MRKFPTGLNLFGVLFYPLVVLGTVGVTHSRAADTQTEFYAGKQIRFLIAHAAGSPYDTFARLVIRHLGNHIPGSPLIVPQNMPGAVGMTMLNTLYNASPRDGTVIGQAGKSVVLEPLYGNDLARFDPRQLNWIGSGQRDVSLCFTRKGSSVQTVDDARAQVLLVGATGPTGDSSFVPKLANSFLGTKMKAILGYPDTSAVALAMDRGEVDGGCGYTSSTLRSARPDWFEHKQINIFLQASLSRTPSFPDVPSFLDFVTDAAALDALRLALSTDPLVRTFVAPPGVPVERVEMLRRAFADTMKDPAFLKEAQQAQFEIDMTTGAEVDAIIKRIYETPRSAVDRVIQIRASGSN